MVAWRINDAARKLSVSRSTLYALANKGKLKVIKIAGRTLVLAAARPWTIMKSLGTAR
jgi:excisionase family DNA binding protein